MAKSKSRVTSTGTLESVEDVRDFLLANDHLYDVAVLDALKQRVGFYEKIEADNVAQGVKAEPELELVEEEEPASEEEVATATSETGSGHLGFM